MILRFCFLLFMFSAVLLACQDGKAGLPQHMGAAALTEVCLEPKLAPVYPWQPKQGAETLCARWAAPAGYKRVECAEGSAQEWLRYLPLLPKEQPVLLYDGRKKGYQQGAASVVDLDIGNRDLQQCADAAMRLKAEYLYGKKRYEDIAFNYTSGHRIVFSDWAQGRKPVVKGNQVQFTAKAGKADYSYANFKKYLQNVFTFAGTASLQKELKRKKIEDIQPGDLFLKGGFPGHAILVLDVAENAQGQRVFLLGQSYMPAQHFHLLHNFSHNKSMSPWYPLEFGEVLHTPEWDFNRADLFAFM